MALSARIMFVYWNSTCGCSAGARRSRVCNLSYKDMCIDLYKYTYYLFMYIYVYIVFHLEKCHGENFRFRKMGGGDVYSLQYVTIVSTENKSVEHPFLQMKPCYVHILLHMYVFSKLTMYKINIFLYVTI